MFGFEIPDLIFFGNSLETWVIAVGIFIGASFALLIARYFVILHLKSLSEKTANRIDDVVVQGAEKVGWPFYVSISLFAAAMYVGVEGFGRRVIEIFTIGVILFYVVRFAQYAIEGAVGKYVSRAQKKGKFQDPTIIYFFSRLGGYSLWLVAALVLIDNAGYDITALVAGLGVAGIAIALGLQNILSDVFSSLSIYFDKPFKVGDFIIVGTDMGVVKKIGIKTTRIQALQGEEIVIANKELTESRIHNFGRMSERRIEFKFGVIYETPLAKLKKINGIVKKSIEKIRGARVDRVHFKKFGGYSLDFEAVYYLPTSDYNAYMDAQEAVNHSLFEQFERERIEFAYPSQKLFVRHLNRGAK
ncbi:MAG TPA: mechanosensitive ion channel family protein [archaeon]|nr:mechanosensitive ion channel family protein [archaeon]